MHTLAMPSAATLVKVSGGTLYSLCSWFSAVEAVSGAECANCFLELLADVETIRLCGIDDCTDRGFARSLQADHVSFGTVKHAPSSQKPGPDCRRFVEGSVREAAPDNG